MPESRTMKASSCAVRRVPSGTMTTPLLPAAKKLSRNSTRLWAWGLSPPGSGRPHGTSWCGLQGRAQRGEKAVGALDLRDVAATFERDQARMRKLHLHALGVVEWDKPVGGAPDELHRHAQLAELRLVKHVGIHRGRTRGEAGQGTFACLAHDVVEHKVGYRRARAVARLLDRLPRVLPQNRGDARRLLP